jgi:hypothetical protein
VRLSLVIAERRLIALGGPGHEPVHGAGTAGMVGEALVGLMLVGMVLCTLVGLALLIRGATSPS